MMPFVPSRRGSRTSIGHRPARESEHELGTPRSSHSRDTTVMAKMGKIMDCTIFVATERASRGWEPAARAFRLHRRPNRRRRHHPHLLPPAAVHHRRRNEVHVRTARSRCHLALVICHLPPHLPSGTCHLPFAAHHLPICHLPSGTLQRRTVRCSSAGEGQGDLDDEDPTFQGERLLVASSSRRRRAGPMESRYWFSIVLGLVLETGSSAPMTAGSFRTCWGRPPRAAGASWACPIDAADGIPPAQGRPWVKRRRECQCFSNRHGMPRFRIPERAFRPR